MPENLRAKRAEERQQREERKSQEPKSQEPKSPIVFLYSKKLPTIHEDLEYPENNNNNKKK